MRAATRLNASPLSRVCLGGDDDDDDEQRVPADAHDVIQSKGGGGQRAAREERRVIRGSGIQQPTGEQPGLYLSATRRADWSP